MIPQMLACFDLGETCSRDLDNGSGNYFYVKNSVPSSNIRICNVDIRKAANIVVLFWRDRKYTHCTVSSLDYLLRGLFLEEPVPCHDPLEHIWVIFPRTGKMSKMCPFFLFFLKLHCDQTV